MNLLYFAQMDHDILAELKKAAQVSSGITFPLPFGIVHMPTNTSGRFSTFHPRCGTQLVAAVPKERMSKMPSWRIA